MTVDDEWTWATTEAVERFQDARGLSEDGSLAQGEVVFRPGPSRVGELQAAVGQELAPGAELGELSTTRREVTVDLDADRQELVRTGDTVTVELPNGDTARGRITEVGKVATEPASEDAEPTIEVTIALRGRAARGSGLDQAPVDVGFASERREHVLAVPVTALLARSGGGFAVETAEGRLVPVDPGVYADDYVEVSGAGLREGMRDEVGTACGTESAKVGPFYCPADHGVYLDTRFFDALARTAGVELGDFAQAYVVAHEVAHHVQTLVGTLQRVRGLDETDPAGANARSVRLELQADCFAGIWKHSRYLRGQLTPSQLADALRAAAVVGSDFQQLSATGTIRPEDWTHGTSRQRQHWVTVGFEKGRPAARDTFRGG